MTRGALSRAISSSQVMTRELRGSASRRVTMKVTGRNSSTARVAARTMPSMSFSEA